MTVMSRGTVLVIEDDAAIRRGLVDALRSEGYATLEARDGASGLKLGLEGEYDLLLLDLVLPNVPAREAHGGDGIDILKAVRNSRPTLPVIVLTAMGSERDRVRGLKQGADDYIVKPFSVSELLARVAAVLRRSPGRPMDIQRITLNGTVIDLAKSCVTLSDGRTTDLSQREAELLRYLASNTDRVISREEILRHVWRLDPAGVDTRTIDMHIARLREKLCDDAGAPSALLTVRGRGYRLTIEGERP